MHGSLSLPLIKLAIGGQKKVLDRDVNGDGIDDLVALDAGSLSDNVLVYLGRSRASFAARAPLSAPVGAIGAAAGDWDGDGRQDLVTLSTMGDSVCVMHSTAN